eukprot:1830792-Lingulodinium_polyedra.AAC.1
MPYTALLCSAMLCSALQRCCALLRRNSMQTHTLVPAHAARLARDRSNRADQGRAKMCFLSAKMGKREMARSSVDRGPMDCGSPNRGNAARLD